MDPTQDTGKEECQDRGEREPKVSVMWEDIVSTCEVQRTLRDFFKMKSVLPTIFECTKRYVITWKGFGDKSVTCM